MSGASRFPASRRIKSRDDFQLVFRRGVVAADGVLVVHAVLHPTPSEGGESDATPDTRLGLSVSKKVGHAPLRNRWKRLIRETFRCSQEVPAGMLLVVRPKKGAEPDFNAIQKSLPKLANKLARKLALPAKKS